MYNQLWIALVGVKVAADDLWEDDSSNNLLAFAKQLNTTNKAVQEGAIFLEITHYSKLLQIIGVFRNYEFGKKRLLDIRRQADLHGISPNEIHQVLINHQQKNEYENLINEIRKNFSRKLREIEV